MQQCSSLRADLAPDAEYTVRALNRLGPLLLRCPQIRSSLQVIHDASLVLNTFKMGMAIAEGIHTVVATKGPSSAPGVAP